MRSASLCGRKQSLSPQTTMAKPEKNHTQIARLFGSHIDPDNGLLPLLIGGLVLIVIGNRLSKHFGEVQPETSPLFSR